LATSVSLTKEKLAKQIDSIESTIVAPRIRDIKISFTLNILYLLALVILTVLVNLNPSFTAGLASFGFGTLGIGTNYQKIQDAVSRYLRDKQELNEGLASLRISLNSCDGDPNCLKDVRDAIEESLKQIKLRLP